MENNSILNIINDLFSKLFSSIDNSIYGILDKITFITPEIIEGNNFKNIIGTSSSNGILLVCNALVFGFIIFYSINYLISHLTLEKSQTPSQFIFKTIIFVAIMNSSIWLCSEIINIVSIITEIIIGIGEKLFNTKISFSNFINLINKEVYISNKEFNMFSFEGVVKSFTSVGFMNLIFTYSLRYILVQVFVIIAPFAILSLTLDKTSWFFKVWLRIFMSLLLEQILIAVILLLAFSIEGQRNSDFVQLLYTGVIYALTSTNTYMRQLFGGISTSVSSSFGKLLKN